MFSLFDLSFILERCGSNQKCKCVQSRSMFYRLHCFLQIWQSQGQRIPNRTIGNFHFRFTFWSKSNLALFQNCFPGHISQKCNIIFNGTCHFGEINGASSIQFNEKIFGVKNITRFILVGEICTHLNDMLHLVCKILCAKSTFAKYGGVTMRTMLQGKWTLKGRVSGLKEDSVENSIKSKHLHGI